MDYQLNIAIDNDGLQKIYSTGQSVTLVKSVISNPLQSGDLPVAWITFQPMNNNTVAWTETFSIYASSVSIVSGATLTQNSSTPPGIQLGWTYTLDNGFFTGTPGDTNTFNAANQWEAQTLTTFGLAQPAVVNNVSVLAPLNATKLLYNQSVTFTPIENVSIFLSSYSDNGVVITQVAGNALTVSLSSQTPSATIGFNDVTNQFYLISMGQDMLSAAEVAGLEPRQHELERPGLNP